MLFTKEIGIDLGTLSDARIGVIEYAVLAGTSGTYVTARIAADTLGKLSSPELVSFVSRHHFKLFNKLKTSAVIVYLAVIADDLVKDNVLLALAGLALIAESLGLGHSLVAVESVDSNGLAVALHTCDSLDALGLYSVSVNLACAGNSDDIYVFTDNSVFLEKLVKAVCIAGLQEYKELALLAGFLDDVLGKIGRTEIIVDEICVQLLS